MKRFVITICLVLLLSSVSFACDDCEGYWEDIYYHNKVQQKHEYHHRYRQTLINGKIRELEAKQCQKIRKRYRRGYYYSNVSFCMIP